MKVEVFRLCVKENLSLLHGDNPLHLIIPIGLVLTFLEPENDKIWLEFVDEGNSSTFQWQTFLDVYDVIGKASFLTALKATSAFPNLYIQNEVIPFWGDETEIFEYNFDEVKREWDISMRRLHQAQSKN